MGLGMRENQSHSPPLQTYRKDFHELRIKKSRKKLFNFILNFIQLLRHSRFENSRICIEVTSRFTQTNFV